MLIYIYILTTGPDDAQPFDAQDAPKKHKKPRHSAVEHYHSDSDRTRSVSPDGNRRSMTNVARINDLLNDAEPATPPIKIRGKPGPKPGGGERGTPRIILKHKHMHIDPITGTLVTTRSILPSHLPLTSATSERAPKPRSLTAHQAAVAENRKERADYIIDRKLKRLDRKNNRVRKREGTFARTWRRIKDMEDPFATSDGEAAIGDEGVTSGIRFDTEGNLILPDAFMKDTTSSIAGDNGVDDRVRLNVIEANAQLNSIPRRGHKQLTSRAKYVNGTNYRGCAGLVPKDSELDDFGEEAIGFAAAIRRTQRRLERWEVTGHFGSSGAATRNADEKQTRGNTINGSKIKYAPESKTDFRAKMVIGRENKEMAEAGRADTTEDVDMSD